jgi:hypothetical protein
MSIIAPNPTRSIPINWGWGTAVRIQPERAERPIPQAKFSVLGLQSSDKMMTLSTVQSCILTSAVFILAERFLGNQILGLDSNTLMRFALAWGACYVAVMITPSLLNTIPSLASTSSLLTSVVAGGLYTGVDMLTKFDPASPMYKFLYLTGSSVVVSYLKW